MSDKRPSEERGGEGAGDALAPWRARIDALDREILERLNERARAAQQVGEIKRARGDAAFHAPERERQVIEKMLAANAGPLPATAIRALYREIMSACLALERPLRVAVLGPQATFSHAAALGVFGSSTEVALVPNFAQVFDAVARGEADYGIVPIENSTEGVVNQTLDAFTESALEIVGETVLPIHYSLMASAGAIADIRHVHSHWQSLAQCRGWLAEHLSGAELHEMPSTAAAAEHVRGKVGHAAVASEVAAKLYDLEILARRIEDDTTNRTRFVVIGATPPKPTGRDKTSVMFSVKHAPGVLYRILGAFADRGISLSTIESRPMRGRAWEYVFFVDLDGHRDDPKVAEALEEVRDRCQMMRILGSYPAATAEGNSRARGVVRSPLPEGEG